MNEEEGFLAAILAEPGDRVALLVYADWLDERGDPRGEYLRLLAEPWTDPERMVGLAFTFDWYWVSVVRDRVGAGCPVRITSGAFEGHAGEVLRASAGAKNMVTVRVLLWGSPMEAEVQSHALERAEPPGPEAARPALTPAASP
jgi:uncharacterized protein (TIGR02996 family)